MTTFLEFISLIEENCFPCCVGFCHTKCESAISIPMSPPLLNPPPTLPGISAPSHHGGCSREPLATQQIPAPLICFTFGGVCMSVQLSVPVPPFKMLIYFPVLKSNLDSSSHPYHMWCLLNCFFFWFFSCYIFVLLKTISTMIMSDFHLWAFSYTI